jgi:phospholipase/lecithinase/hemolysin
VITSWKKEMNMNCLLLRALAVNAVALIAVFSAPAYAGGSHRFVVFGDSLSDPGNFFIEYGLVSKAPFEPVPSAPYDIHGHHFSDGPTWIEQLADELDTRESGRPALERPGVYTNYAMGRARARPNAPAFPAFDLSTQVALFLNDFGGQAPGHATYVIWIGANDLNDAISALQTDPSGATSTGIIQTALGTIASNIQALWSAGARSFLIPNEPDLGLTPVLQLAGPAAVGAATQLSEAFDAGLIQVLGQLQALPQIEFKTLDVFTLLHVIVSDPHAYRLKDVQDACLIFFVTVDAICERPNRFLFWDGIHPTVAGHEILEDAAQHLLHAR